MKRIKFIFTALLLLFSLNSFAQNVTIKGKVTDASSGEPIPFASIQIKGTMTGTATHDLGEYSISAPTNGVLVFSSIGYKNLEIPINGRTSISASLEPEALALEDVIVVAYGSVTKKDFTGSVASFDGKKLEKRPLTNVANALEGVSTGIQFTSASGQPGSSGSIRIRGIGSINASSDPLYIVDGVPYSDGMSNLNSDDIESISVLKDASSSALYGSRAANGVVIITTKKGRSEKIQFVAKVNYGVSVRGIPEYDRVNAYDYYPLLWEAYRNSVLTTTTPAITLDAANLKATNDIKGLLVNNPFNVADNAIVGTDGKLNPAAKLLYTEDLDWAKAIARVGHKQDYSVSASGATNKADYYFSIGYMKEQGYSIKSDMNRATARINMNVQPTKWLKAGVNLSGTSSKSSITNDDSSTGYVNPFFFSRDIGPIYPIYQHNADGSYLLDEQGQKLYEWDKRGASGSPGRHVIAETLWNDNMNRRNVINSRTNAEITFIKGLKFSVNLGYDLRNQLDSRYDNTKVGDGAPAGRSNATVYFYETINFNQLLSYQNSIGNHNFNLLAGHETYDRSYEYVYGMKQGIIAEGNTKLVNFTTINSFTGYSGNYRTEGYFARADYNYYNKYYVSASFRRDGTSKFAPQSRWGNFWSLGGSWRLDQENFLKSSPAIDLLKLRLSYGLVGNDGTDSWYPWQSVYDINRYGNAPGFIQSTSAGNDKLQWEVNKSFDVAIDYGFFKNRITGSIEFFHRISDNLLFSVPLPESSGVLAQWQNVGCMYNQGIEFQLGADIIRSRDFVWNTLLNASHVENKITRLPEGQPEIISGTKKLSVGHSIYDFWLYDFAEVNPETGDAMYYKDIKDAEGNVTTQRGDKTNDYALADEYYVGTSIPMVYGSWSNTFSYKGLELSVLLTYQLGGKIYDSAYIRLMTPTYGGSLHADAHKRWKVSGDVTDVPRLDNSRNAYQYAASSRWLTDASYLGVRNATLSYSFPKKVCEKLTLSGLSIFVNGENLYSFTARKGMNPQYNFAGTQSNVYGYARAITFGLNVKF